MFTAGASSRSDCRRYASITSQSRAGSQTMDAGIKTRPQRSDRKGTAQQHDRGFSLLHTRLHSDSQTERKDSVMTLAHCEKCQKDNSLSICSILLITVKTNAYNFSPAEPLSQYYLSSPVLHMALLQSTEMQALHVSSRLRLFDATSADETNCLSLRELKSFFFSVRQSSVDWCGLEAHR